RFVIERLDCADGEMDYTQVLEHVGQTLGIIGFCPCTRTTEFTLEGIIPIAVAYMRENYGVDEEFSFKVETRRVNKDFPARSYDVSADIGEAVLDAFPNSRVDVHKPKVLLHVEIRHSVYIYSKVIPGIGGLPAGSSGKGMLMLSGGIDSPVAGYMVAKRGLEFEAVYFDSPPFTSERALQKVLDLAQVLAGYSGYVKLYVVPFTETQTFLYERTPHEKLTIFMKRAMLKITKMLASRCDAHCIVTGDSLGQVASQTAEALEAIDAGSDVTILRPLAGLDKHEIIAVARKIGTYEISVRPFEDCCTVFVAKHPEIRPKAHIITKMESKITELPEMLQRAADGAKVYEFKM
ncbi:MAG: tRNA 4-thiouridine(8) synthase ThiI, partial [Defluviitaleaceae bacterium]|nr:tRNA 4-thiouridine(8) synthase ThiI [Defluviitaleaceae bacterium]